MITVGDLVICTLWVVLKHSRLKRFAPLAIDLFLLSRTITVNLTLRNLMPVGINLTDISVLEYQIWLAFLSTTTFGLYDFKETLFVKVPIFILGVFF